MTAEIHAISAVIDGLRDPTDLAVGFEHDRRDVRATQQFEGDGQSRRPGSRHYSDFFAIMSGCIHAEGITEFTRRQS